MSLFSRIAAAILVLLIAASPAAAVQPTGSAGWTNGGWTNVEASLYTGPGTRYEEIGTVGGGLRIRVDRCSGLWCQIHAKNLKGWMELGNISFGQGPHRLFSDQPRLPVHFGGPVCLYTGHAYSGREVCLPGGRTIKDLALLGLDNSFSSIKVGTGSVLACRDRNFRSYCLIINKDEPRLDGFLDDGMTSVEVY
jgi:uncharacterized protein YraI